MHAAANIISNLASEFAILATKLAYISIRIAMYTTTQKYLELLPPLY